MSSARNISIDQLVDPTNATVMVRLDGGKAVDAWFQLDGLPRVEGFLVGKPVTEVPGIVQRLCGICPASHHLAGVAALDRLLSAGDPPPAAMASRRLLNLASILDAHATRLFQTGPEHALAIRAFAKQVMVAAGSPGYFPTTAIPGGVREAVPADIRDELLASGQQILAAMEALVAAAPQSDTPPLPFDGPDIALTDAAGSLDLFGDRLRAINPDGGVLIEGATVDEWQDLVTETYPNHSASRPYLTALGPTGHYRVGPSAQLRIGPFSTPAARAAQQTWDGGALTARAIVGLHAVEEILKILAEYDATGPLVATSTPSDASATSDTTTRGTTKPGTATSSDASATSDTTTRGTTVASGWVESPRGLLVHTYARSADGTLDWAAIVTPTAQNEPWLRYLLRTVTADLSGETGPATVPPEVVAQLETAIRTADPCLPCSSAPPGQMALTVMLTCENEFPTPKAG